MIKRPLVCCGVSCFAGGFAGIWFYGNFGSSIFWNGSFLLAYSLIFFLSLFFFLIMKNIPCLCKWTGRSGIFLFFLIPFLFFLCAVRSYAHSIPSALEQAAEEKKEGRLCGTVASVASSPKANRVYLKNVVFSESASDISLKGGDSMVLLYDTSGKELLPGNVIAAQAMLETFSQARNPGQYDEYLYQKIRGRDAFAYTGEVTVLDGKTEQVSYILYVCKRKLASVFESILEEKEASLVKAMLLGEKAGIPKEVKELYGRNGISHILAISGLHISMLGMMVYWILRWLLLNLDLGRRFCGKVSTRLLAFLVQLLPFCAAAVFLALYGNMAGMAVSVKRAMVMFFLSLSAGIVGRTYDFLTGIALAVLVVLLQEPLYLLDSGFWMSFGAVFGIAVLFPVIKRTYSDTDQVRKNRSPGKIWEYQKMGKRALWGFIGSIMKKMEEGLLVSISVFLMTFPIVIKTYYSYPLYGVFLNLLVLPLMSVLLPAAFLAGVAGLVSLFMASIFGIFLEKVLGFYEMLCIWTEKLPYAVQLTGCPSVRKMVFYYLSLSGLIFFMNRRSRGEKKEKWKKCKIPEKAAIRRRRIERGCVCLYLWILIGSMYKVPSEQCRLNILDVGQGDAIVLELPHGKTVTVDGGSSDVPAVGEYRILPFLKSERIQKIECAFLTHMDKDHISGIEELLEMEGGQGGGIWIENLAVPAVFKENSVWQEIKQAALQKGTKILYFKAGDTLEIAGVQFLCMHPPEDFQDASENAASLVLKVIYGEFDALLMGDLEGKGEETLMKVYAEELKETDLLKVAHHGSKNSSTEEFLKLCMPKLSVISCGQKNRYGHPHEEVLKRLEKTGSHMVFTKDSGAVTVITDGKQMQIQEYFLRKYKKHGKLFENEFEK